MNFPKQTIPLLLFCLIASSAAANENGAAKILQTGSFHGNEVPKNIGQDWFALVVTNDRAELSAVTPKITTDYDDVLDNRQNKASYSGKKVEVGGKEPLLLIKMLGLSTGLVTQAKISDSSDGQKIVFLNMEYLFQHKCEKPQGQNPLTQCQIYLVGNGITQWIADAQEGNDDYALNIRVKWAGDIDRDGKLDLILEESTNNGGSVDLYLSSPAAKGKHVIKAAEFSTSGC
jgi:hypothetical protein